jgi:hypothetical protein
MSGLNELEALSTDKNRPRPFGRLPKKYFTTIRHTYETSNENKNIYIQNIYNNMSRGTVWITVDQSITGRGRDQLFRMGAHPNPGHYRLGGGRKGNFAKGNGTHKKIPDH